MGGILMLLAELGYLNIFLGGGFQAIIADTGRSSTVAYFSDVPEWAALIANVRDWWRSYPWMALYPGAAFFLSIMAFNILGEGLATLPGREPGKLESPVQPLYVCNWRCRDCRLILLASSKHPIRRISPGGFEIRHAKGNAGYRSLVILRISRPRNRHAGR